MIRNDVLTSTAKNIHVLPTSGHSLNILFNIRKPSISRDITALIEVVYYYGYTSGFAASAQHNSRFATMPLHTLLPYLVRPRQSTAGYSPPPALSIPHGVLQIQNMFKNV